MNTPTRTSYSAISTFEGCQMEYFFSYIEGRDRPAGDAASRGTRLHLSGELFLKGTIKAEQLPVDYWRVKPTMLEYKKLRAKSEEVWCINRKWERVETNHPDTFIKAIVDVHWIKPKVTLNVTDLKTGKVYPLEHADQLQLYGTLGLCIYPSVAEAKVGGLYIDQGKRDSEATLPRKMFAMLKDVWTERAERVLGATKFEPNPTLDNCKWCPFHAKKGGPCKDGYEK